MRRRKRDITLTLALCLSLTVHAWLVRTAAWRYVRDNARVFLPGPPRLPEIAVVPPPQPQRPEQRPAPPPPMFDPMDQLGDTDGKSLAGATAATPGETPLRAPQANQEQADLSLDPAGPGDGGAAPGAAMAMPARPPGAATAVFEPEPPTPPLRLPQDQPAAERQFAARPPLEAAKENETEQAEPPSPPAESKLIAIVEPGLEAKSEDRQTPPRQERAVSQPPVSSEPIAEATPPNDQDVTPRPPRPQPPRPPQPRPPSPPVAAAPSAAAADPSPQAESESDAFSTEASADFASGKTVARFGRKHKIFRPKIEMAGYADMIQMRGSVIVVLKLHIDAAGNVEKVEILKSSGSINIDQPTLIAAYRWWFEPAKDSAGRPKKDVIRFTCRFV